MLGGGKGICVGGFGNWARVKIAASAGTHRLKMFARFARTTPSSSAAGALSSLASGANGGASVAGGAGSGAVVPAGKPVAGTRASPRKQPRAHISLDTHGPVGAPVDVDSSGSVEGRGAKRSAIGVETLSVPIAKEAGAGAGAGAGPGAGAGTGPKRPSRPGHGVVPAGWKDQWDAIMRMRSARDAPVDTIGCHMLADPAAPPPVFRFQVLVSLMLSSQTKDEMTSAAMQRLKGFGLTPAAMACAQEKDIDALISNVGFHTKKAQFIKRTAQILLDKYGGDIPGTVEELMELPGVGPKMSYLVMQVAWKQCVGIGVDVHVHRICNTLRWVKSETPEQTRAALESWLPHDMWGEINALLVGFGQQTCKAVKPLCGGCLLRDTCPVGRKWKP